VARDFDIVQAIVEALTKTEAFDKVFPYPVNEWRPDDNRQAVAFVALGDGQAETIGSPSSDGDEATVVEVHTLALAVGWRDADPERRAEKVAHLRAVAAKAIDGQEFAGANRDLTLMVRWRYNVATPPWKFCQANVRLQQIVGGPAAMDVAEAIDLLE
jgi:hypothetical protein